MKKIIIVISFVFGLFITSSLFARLTSSDPVFLVKSVSDQMINALKKNKASLKTNPKVVYSLAQKIIVPYADLTAMSKYVLPPNVWNHASPGQRKEFQSLFSTTLIRTYTSAMAEYNNQTMEFFPIRGDVTGKSMITVDSQIHSNEGPPISMSYKMLRRGSTWVLFDITVEGVSMLESFSSQFADVLNHSNMAELINALKRHNAK